MQPSGNFHPVAEWRPTYQVAADELGSHVRLHLGPLLWTLEVTQLPGFLRLLDAAAEPDLPLLPVATPYARVRLLLTPAQHTVLHALLVAGLTGDDPGPPPALAQLPQGPVPLHKPAPNPDELTLAEGPYGLIRYDQADSLVRLAFDVARLAFNPPDFDRLAAYVDTAYGPPSRRRRLQNNPLLAPTEWPGLQLSIPKGQRTALANLLREGRLALRLLAAGG